MRVLESITKAGTWQSEVGMQYGIKAKKQCESHSHVGKQETQKDVVESMWRRERKNCKKG